MNSLNGLENAKSRLILALDVPNLEAANALLDRVEDQVGVIKIGLELFTSCGPKAVEEIIRRGYRVFLDLKLHDIPNTVTGAVRAAKSLGVSMLTVHTGGGLDMLVAAREAADDNILLLGVTLLTSLGRDDLAPVCIQGEPAAIVARRVELAREAGIKGIVCSPKEIIAVRERIGIQGKIVTPGIRPSGVATLDQKRAATPESAISDGADYLVVGRPISSASDPSKAANEIVCSIANSLKAK